MNLRLLCLALLLTAASATPALAAPDYSTPKATLDTYLAACKAGDYAAADACFTKSSRDFLAASPDFTKGRDTQLLKFTYDKLSPLDFKLEQVNPKRAILQPSDATVPPFFLRQQTPGEGWRIDFHFMSNYIRANSEGWSWVNPKALDLWKGRE